MVNTSCAIELKIIIELKIMVEISQFNVPENAYNNYSYVSNKLQWYMKMYKYIMYNICTHNTYMVSTI